MISQLIQLLAVLVAGFLSGYMYKECPVPKDPDPIIREVERIRYVDKPIIKEVVRRVETIIKEPFYTGECLDTDGLRAITDLIESTAAGRADLSSTAPASTPIRNEE